MRTLGGIAGDFVGMLDWMLPVALLAGLAGATYGAAFMHAGRWSLGAAPVRQPRRSTAQCWLALAGRAGA